MVIRGQESGSSGQEKLVEGVEAGTTAAYTPAGELPGQQIGGTGYEPITPDNTPAKLSQENVDAIVTTDDGDILKLPDSASPSQRKNALELHEKDSFGGALTLMSMGIVLAALAVLSGLFLLFGKISASLQQRRKHRTTPITVKRTEGADSGEAIAAIAAAMAEHFSGKHDIEDTILTIKRMRRAYSPWNSKIYNIRVAPEVHKP